MLSYYVYYNYIASFIHKKDKFVLKFIFKNDKNKQDPNAQRNAYAKKTDEIQPDVDENEEQENATTEEPTTERAASPRTIKKSDLDKPIVSDENSSSAVDDDDSTGTDNDNTGVCLINTQ